VMMAVLAVDVRAVVVRMSAAVWTVVVTVLVHAGALATGRRIRGGPTFQAVLPSVLVGVLVGLPVRAFGLLGIWALERPAVEHHPEARAHEAAA